MTPNDSWVLHLMVRNSSSTRGRAKVLRRTRDLFPKVPEFLPEPLIHRCGLNRVLLREINLSSGQWSSREIDTKPGSVSEVAGKNDLLLYKGCFKCEALSCSVCRTPRMLSRATSGYQLVDGWDAVGISDGSDDDWLVSAMVKQASESRTKFLTTLVRSSPLSLKTTTSWLFSEKRCIPVCKR